MNRMHWAIVLVACLWGGGAMPASGSEAAPDAPAVQGGDVGGTDPGGDEPEDPGDPGDPQDPNTRAVGDSQVYQEYAERMRSAEMVSPLGSEIFGESVNLFDGATTFNSTDIDIPGNSALPVRLQRRFEIQRVPQMVGSEFGGLGNWDIDVPYISGVFPTGNLWGHFPATGVTVPRCSSNYVPAVSAPFELRDVWSGNSVHLPGQGDKEVLYTDSRAHSGPGYMIPVSGGPYRWTTRDRDYLTCTTSMSNPFMGEGFILHTADGWKYTFDYGVTRNAGRLGQGTNQIHRVRVLLLATRVEDPFGNYVAYTYNLSGYPTLIQGFLKNGGGFSLERTISIDYTSGPGCIGTRACSASAHGRTWNFSYDSAGRLQRVYQPQATDISRPFWEYGYIGNLDVPYQNWDGNSGAICQAVPEDGPHPFKLVISHPSSAKGEFSFDYVRTYRSGVALKRGCVTQGGNGKITVPYFSDGFQLGSKKISGPGLPATEWYHNYDFPNPVSVGVFGFCADSAACAAHPLERTVMVAQPDGTAVLHRFGIKFDVNHGRLLGTQTRSSTASNPPSSAILTTTTLDYFSGTPTLFPDIYGISYGADDPNSVRVRPVIAEAETRQGTTFSRTYSLGHFDRFARPKRVTKSGSHSRTEDTVYRDRDDPAWILGRVQSVSLATGTEMEAYDHHPVTLARTAEYRFGRLIRTMQYRADGTLEWVRNAGLATQETRIGVPHRGIPQSITYPDQTSTSATVNDHGQITSVTTERNYITNYDYREDGRLYRIRRTDPDPQVWNSTQISFAPAGPEYGVAPGHWTQVVTTGNGTKRTVFDALWRPVVTVLEPGDSDPRITVRRYDHAGRETFVSHPVAFGTVTSVNKGASTVYDALGRVTATTLDSELGLLGTLTTYPGSAFMKVFVNARGYSTTTEFKTFDAPSEDFPSRIIEPESTTTEIARDEFGMPTAVTRSGNFQGSMLSTTRSYVYDTHKRLCKTVEPETFATVRAYDAAGNVEWQASGQDFSGYQNPFECQHGLVPASQKTSYTYDTRNRLRDTIHGDNSPAIHVTYHADGLPWTVHSGGHNWTYAYNGRGLLTSEHLNSGTSSFSIGHDYNANGHEASLTYPDGSSVDFAPNGLGEPTRAGAYATGATRHLNGALKGFSYGNGVVRHSTQTLNRGLPDAITETKGGTTILADNYDWDENANVTAIASTAPGDIRSRWMSYDGRDRLTGTYFGSLGAQLSFTYDPLDNLRSYFTPGRVYTHDYDPVNGRLTGIRNETHAPMYAYAYDGTAGKRGHVTTRTKTSFDPNTQVYTFDLGNRLVQLGGSFNETYTYDGHGRRTTRQVGAAAKTFQIYAMDGKLLQVGATGAPGSERYVYFGKHLVAKLVTGAGGSTTVRYQHTDGLGSPTVETTAGGTEIPGSRLLHEPYGLVSGGTPVQGPGFTGHVLDLATGLSYMQQRYYDPVAGRFLSVDPVATDAGTGGNFNRYWYANNNPYKFTDPDGRMASMKDHPSLKGSVRTFVMNDDSGGGGGEEVKDITECRTAGCTNPALVGAAKKTADVASDVADVVDDQVTDPTNYLAGPALKGIGLGVKAGVGALVFKTTKDAVVAAEKLGFKRINETIKGQAIFSDGKRFITRDIDGHNGGAWKMADSVRNLGSKETRMGTFDANLNKIGD